MQQLDPELEAERAQWANKSYVPEPTWFIRRGDGEIITATEALAWEILNPRSNWQRRDFTLLGYSDMKGFKARLVEGEAKLNVYKAQLDDLRNETRRYEDSYERFKFVELLNDNDEKVLKLNGILSDKYAEIEKLKKLIEDHKSNIYKEAINQEVMEAQKVMKLPENQDVMTPRGDRQAILNSWRFTR